MWTFYKRQSNGVCYSDDHSEEVLCAALSSDGKKAITGQYNYRPQTKFAKVTFSYVSVCPREACMAWGYAWWGACMVGGMHGRGGVHGRGACVAGWHAWQGGHSMVGGMHGGGCAWQGAYMVGAMCGRGHA